MNVTLRSLESDCSPAIEYFESELDFEVLGKTYRLGIDSFYHKSLYKKFAGPFEEFLWTSNLMNEFRKLSKPDQQRIMKLVVDAFVAVKTPVKVEKSRIDTGIDFSKFFIGQDVFGQGMVVVDSKTFQVTDWDPWAFIQSLPKECEAEEKVPIHKRFEPAILQDYWYEKWDLKSQEVDLLNVNTYIAPEFRHLERPKVPESLYEIHPLLDKALNSLCMNNPETLHVLLSWCKVATMDRCRTILVLLGVPASGKSFIGRLLGALVGEDYYNEAQNEFFQTRFVHNLGVKRVILIDEGEIKTVAAMNNAKKYCETHFAPERKGKDVEHRAPIHASMIVTNNNYFDLAFSPEERKFTVLDVGQKKLAEVFEKSEWDALEALLKDNTFLIDLYNFLRDYETDWTPTSDYQGEAFWRCVIEGGLNDKNKAIYDTLVELEDDEPVGITQICNRASRRGGSSRTFRVTKKCVENLMTSFKAGGRPIAVWVGDRNEIRSLVSGKRTNDLSEENMIDELDDL